MDRHRTTVATIAAQTRGFYERRAPFRIYHGSTNTTRPSTRRRDQLVDTSKLNHVLHVDVQKKSVLVEPNVPMDDLVAATLQHGLIPPVVMEFPAITAGGGFMGQAGESSSFRYGLFDRTVTWLEMVLATGEVVTASQSNNPDLFYGAAASFGTLGITTLLEIDLIEAATYVELTYHIVDSMSAALQILQDLTQDPTTDYLDSIMFSIHSGVVCAGRLSNVTKNHVRRFTRATDPWFYRHVEKLVQSSPTSTIVESVPVTDYFFRYDRGCFWTGIYAFKYFITPFNRITRWILDTYMHTRVMYHALHKSDLSKQYIIQDIAVPFPAAAEFLHYVDESWGHFPIWLAPIKQSGKRPHTYPGLLIEKAETKAPDDLLNFGIWGPGSPNRRKFVEQNRELENKVQSLNGRKWLYAHMYFTEEEFWNIYDRKSHDAMRAKWKADYLPTIYDKTKVDYTAEEKAIQESWMIWLLALFWSIWPLSGLYGVYQATLGGDYLLPQQSWWTGVSKKED